MSGVLVSEGKGVAAFETGERAGRGARLRGSMLAVLIALTAALAAIGLLITQTVLAQQDARTRAMNEGDMLIAFQAVMRSMLEAESSQRAYVLTSDADYLSAYDEARTLRARSIADLRDVAARTRDAAGESRIGWIIGITDAKFDEMDRTVALTRAGMQPQALMIVNSDIGRQQMDAIRAAITGETRERARHRRDAFERALALERLLLPLIAVLGLAILGLVITGFRAERSRAAAAAAAEQAAALREANERAQLLARELSHRVKNLFSVILSIVTLSGRKQGTSREVVESIRARIHALSLAHATSQGGGEDANVRLDAVVAATMEPYADEEGERVRIGGPEVQLPVRMVTPIGMIVHELATNAVKYGALSVEGGTVQIRWQLLADGDRRRLTLDWVEDCGSGLADPVTAPPSAGFGSQMTTLAARQLGGSLEREWPATGAVVRLAFPLP